MRLRKRKEISLVHSKTKPYFFDVNANLDILFVRYENMSQNGHLLFKTPEKQKAMEPEWDHTEKKKEIYTPKDPGRANVKTAQGLKKKDPVILKELFRDAYWRKYPHLNERKSPNDAKMAGRTATVTSI